MTTKQRTATIERYHVWGTQRHALEVSYRGKVLHGWKHGADCFAIVQDDPTRDEATGLPVDVQAARQHAKAHGFTHVRITGDWSHRTKPKGGKV